MIIHGIFPSTYAYNKRNHFFLENIYNIEQVINSNPIELTNLIFGDIYHPHVYPNSIAYISSVNASKNKNIKKIILEISSRKVRYYNDIPLNYYYSCNHEQYNLTEKFLSDDEIEKDICYIIKLCKYIFNENAEIHIIPHLNLKTISTNDYIPDRNRLVKLLEELSLKYAIKIHNVGKYIENNSDNICFLEEYMKDSTHYSKGYDIIKQYLIGEIYDNSIIS
jgi:hypothetical protein